MPQKHDFHSLVIPVFNEQEGLGDLERRIIRLLRAMRNERFEVVFVNDGSQDASGAILEEMAASEPRFKVIHLSRNFGHQIAVSAGLEWASGDTVTILDADLQDPPELIPAMLQKWREGCEVVYGVRRSRKGETRFKLWTAHLFYSLIRRLTNIELPMEAGDFRLLDRKVVDAFTRLPERRRFVRGMCSWLGFRQEGILYDRDERHHGDTHYPLKKMVRLALDAITSFSLAPLQIATWLGTASAILCGAIAGWTLYERFVAHTAIPGWTSVMLTILFLGSAQLLTLGVLGEYVGRTHEEAKGRPLYLITKQTGFGRISAVPESKKVLRRKA